jgi:hypothetical protein
MFLILVLTMSFENILLPIVVQLLKFQIMGKTSDGSLYYEFSMMTNVTEEDGDIDL